MCSSSWFKYMDTILITNGLNVFKLPGKLSPVKWILRGTSVLYSHLLLCHSVLTYVNRMNDPYSLLFLMQLFFGVLRLVVLNKLILLCISLNVLSHFAPFCLILPHFCQLPVDTAKSRQGGRHCRGDLSVQQQSATGLSQTGLQSTLYSLDVYSCDTNGTAFMSVALYWYQSVDATRIQCL